MIVQPAMAVLLYAANSKTSCYTGFWKGTSRQHHLNFLEFLAVHALPGPDSIINCVIQQYGPAGPTTFMTVKKTTALS